MPENNESLMLDRYIAKANWTESRANESMVRFWRNLLAESGEIWRSITVNQLPATAINEAAFLLESWFETQGLDKYSRPHYVRYYIQQCIDSESRGNEKPAKFIAKCIKTGFNIKLPSDIKAKLGTILTESEPKTYRIRFSMGCSGNAQSYYHESSCYWTCYAGSRDYIEASQGGAIRIYDDNTDVIGRVWFVPYTDDNLYGLLLFNAYGKDHLQHIKTWGDIVASALHVTKQNTYARFYEPCDPGFYLNSPTTVVVGSCDTPSSEPLNISKDLDVPYTFKYHHENSRSCARCGDHVHEDDLHYVDSEDEYICESCLDWHYIYIYNGDYEGYYDTDNVVDVRVGSSSYDTSHYHEDDSNIINLDGEWYLKDSEYVVCDEYGDYYHIDSDEYAFCDDGVWPVSECTYNEESGEYTHELS